MFPQIYGTLAANKQAATYQVITTGAATHTINSLGLSAATLVDWGDGSTSTLSGTALRTHNYAGAGTWTVTIYLPENVTTFDIRDNKVDLNSADIAPMVNVSTFIATALHSGTFDSADVSAWQPNDFRMYSMPAGYSGTFDSADVSAWQPTTFYLFVMPSGYSGTFDSADVSAWQPTIFYLHSMPAGYSGTFDSADVSAWQPTIFYLHSMPAIYTITISATGFAAWTATNNFQMQSNALSQAAVNSILWQLYQATVIPRTTTGGTINIGGSNAAPSGTFQAASACPVTVATDGKEIAYELLNDSCGAGFNKWSTVTITT